MDGGGAQVVFVGTAEGGERRLERDFQKLRQDEDADAGGQSCAEIFSSPEQSQPPPPPI